MKINERKAGVILTYLSIIGGSIISIFYTPVMLRYLGQNQYGVNNLVSSVVSYLSLFSFGFAASYIRFYAKNKINNDEQSISVLNGMYFLLFSIIAIVSFLCGLVLIYNIEAILGDKFSSEEIAIARVLMWIMVFNISLSFIARVFNSYITANEKYLFQKLLLLIKTIFGPFFTLPLLIAGYGAIGMVAVTTVINLIVEVAYAAYCFKKIKIKFCFNRFDKLLFKDLFIFSSYIFVNMIVDQINWNVDKYLIGRFWGAALVAVYSIAAQLNSYYMNFSSAITSVFVPRINKMVSSGESDSEITKLFTRVGRIQYLFLMLILTGLIFFGKTFIFMWAGPEYSDAYFIVLILAIPTTVPLIQNIGIEIQRAKNMHRFRSVVYLAIALANIFISIPLTRYYSGIGAAIGTSFALIVGNIIFMNIYYQKRIKLDMLFFWKEITSASKGILIPIITGIIILKFFTITTILQLLLGIACYSIIYVISVWFFSCNSYEKELFIKPISAILKIFRRQR